MELVAGKSTTKIGKEKMSTAVSFSLIHAAGLGDGTERQILPTLKAGVILLADMKPTVDPHPAEEAAGGAGAETSQVPARAARVCR